MDRRQRKTRNAIFSALIRLLSRKDFSKITVGEIIQEADVGRATFYAHFETKDFLLKALCEDLFCHIFDSGEETDPGHSHLFHCEAPEGMFLHLMKHLQQNDNHILDLLSCPNNGLFLQFFKENLQNLIARQLPLFESRKHKDLPDSFWCNHIASVFVETVQWWIGNGMHESPETITSYFYLAV